ncbi:hypothetical protein F9K50_06880, partial [bacterium]
MIRIRGGSDHLASSTLAAQAPSGAGPRSASERVDALLARDLGASWSAADLAELRSLRKEGDPELLA